MNYQKAIQIMELGNSCIDIVVIKKQYKRLALKYHPDKNPNGREMFETWYKMIAMLQSGLNISPVITHHFPIDDYQNAFQIMASGQSGKVILDWE